MKKIFTTLFNFLGFTTILTQNSDKTMTQKSFDNLKHLPEIVQYIDEKTGEDFFEIDAPQFVTNIFINEYLYPDWVKDWEDKDQLLQMAKAKNLMEPIETLMKNAGFSLLSKKDVNKGTSYYYVDINFGLKPLPKFKGVLKQDAVHAFLIPYKDDEGKAQVKIMLPENGFGGYFSMMKKAKLLDPNSTNETDQHYLQKLSEAVEIICNEFKITTEKNQGKFVEVVQEDPEKLLHDFIEATRTKELQSEKDILNFKKDWNLIQKEPEKYKEKLIDEGYFDEDSEIDTDYFTQYLLSEFLYAYDTDWKIDHEELSEFISEEIKQDFSITYEETLQKPHIIAEKIEKESDYTLLNIDTQMDSYSFFLCKKSEKDKILALARKLKFPIEDY